MVILRRLFAAVLRSALLLTLGLERSGRVPEGGPVILAANHNSHLDIFVLLSLVPLRALPRVRSVGAADYLNQRPWLRWPTRVLLGALAVPRGSGRTLDEVLAPIVDALDEGSVVLFFPEGTRGEPGRLGPLRRGIARLHELRPDVPVVPVRIDGTERVLPRGAKLPIPFTCSAAIGAPIPPGENTERWLTALRDALAPGCLEALVRDL